jgi:uncharacterized RDD family membrane protein YckC
MTTTSNSSEQIDLMHWVLRLIAYIIDSIIILIPTAIIYFIALVAIVSTGFFALFGIWLLLPLILGIIEVLYFVILDVSWGATIGKRVLGLHVQMTNGGKVTFDKAFIRNISKIYPLLLLLDWLIGILTTGDKRQKFTDRWAGTIVVQTGKSPIVMTSPPPSSSPPPPPTAT